MPQEDLYGKPDNGLDYEETSLKTNMVMYKLN